MICEMCESMTFLKEEGMYICQGCGMKFSAEEAKKLMKEVDNMSAKSINTEKIDNMMKLAQNAIDQANNTEAESYANKILEFDSENAQAWLIKGQAVGWQTTLSNIRMLEMMSCFEKALNNVSDDLIDEYKKKVQSTTEAILKGFLSITITNFSNKNIFINS